MEVADECDDPNAIHCPECEYLRPKILHDEIVYETKTMSVYGELDPMVEHMTQFAFKGKREHISKVNMPNMAYPNQHIDIEIPHGSRDHIIIPDTIKTTFNLGSESTGKARSVVNNVGRALVKKRCSCLVQKTSTRLATQIFMTRTRIFT